jgi:uncharacterized protein YybS (DUF2232 family)
VTGRSALSIVRGAAIAAVLFLAGGLIPLAGGVAMMFAPVPILFQSVGYPRPLSRALAGVAIAAILVGVGAGLSAGVGYGITFGLATAIMCYMLEREKPFELIVLVAAGAVLATGAFGALAVTGSPGALAAALQHDLSVGMEHGEKFYKVLGMEKGMAADTRANILELATRLAPALIALSAALTVLANLGIFWRWGGKERLTYSLFGDLVRWAAPEWLIWVFLATGFGLFIPFVPLSTIALDCFVCVAAVYFCHGLAIMAYYFRLLKMPALARGLIYFVTALQPVLGALVCAAGVFDMWIDLRRLKPPSREAGNFGDFF